MSFSKSRVKSKSSYARPHSPPYPWPCPSIISKLHSVLGILPPTTRPSYNSFSPLVSIFPPLSLAKLPTYSKVFCLSNHSQVVSHSILSQLSASSLIIKSHWHSVFLIKTKALFGYKKVLRTSCINTSYQNFFFSYINLFSFNFYYYS